MRYFGPRHDMWAKTYASGTAYFMWNQDEYQGYWIAANGTVIQRSTMDLQSMILSCNYHEVDNPTLPDYMQVDDGL